MTLGYLAREVILVHKDVLQPPHLKTVDVAQFSLPVEVLSTVFALLDKLIGKAAEELHALRQVVLIPIVVLARPVGRRYKVHKHQHGVTVY